MADVANGVWYAAEGDYTNAGLSFASAVPIAGYGASVAKGARYVDGAVDADRATDNTVDAVRTTTRAADGKLDDVARAGDTTAAKTAAPTKKSAATTKPSMATAAPPKPKDAPAPAASTSCLRSLSADTDEEWQDADKIDRGEQLHARNMS